jgi:hypothetical protein
MAIMATSARDPNSVARMRLSSFFFASHREIPILTPMTAEYSMVESRAPSDV